MLLNKKNRLFILEITMRQLRTNRPLTESLVTAALAQDGCTFHKQWYFVDNAQSKSAERT